MSYYPDKLKFAVRRLPGFSKNTFRLRPLSNDSAFSGQQVVINLPSNSLLDLSTFALSGYVNICGAGGAAIANADWTNANNAMLPKRIESLIQRVEIRVNDQTIMSGCNNYNTLFNCLADMSFGTDCTNKRKLLQLESDVVAPAAAANNLARTAQPFTILNWLGLDSFQPACIDTSLTGTI